MQSRFIVSRINTCAISSTTSYHHRHICLAEMDAADRTTKNRYFRFARHESIVAIYSMHTERCFDCTNMRVEMCARVRDVFGPMSGGGIRSPAICTLYFRMSVCEHVITCFGIPISNYSFGIDEKSNAHLKVHIPYLRFSAWRCLIIQNRRLHMLQKCV